MERSQIRNPNYVMKVLILKRNLFKKNNDIKAVKKYETKTLGYIHVSSKLLKKKNLTHGEQCYNRIRL